MNWENKVASTGIEYSRYVASWIKAMRVVPWQLNPRSDKLLRDWLKTMELTDQEIKEIEDLALNGKLEFQESAREFLRSHQ